MNHQPALTSAEYEAYAAIKEFIASRGRSPSHAELADKLRVVRSRVGVLVAALDRKGYISRIWGEAFGIRLTDPEAALTHDQAFERIGRDVQRCASGGMNEKLAQLGAELTKAFGVSTKCPREIPDEMNDILGRIPEERLCVGENEPDDPESDQGNCRSDGGEARERG